MDSPFELAKRLRQRASIRRGEVSRPSKPERLTDLLLEAAEVIESQVKCRRPERARLLPREPVRIFIVKWGWNIEHVYLRESSARSAVSRMRREFPLVDPREFDVITRNVIWGRWPEVPLY